MNIQWKCLEEGDRFVKDVIILIMKVEKNVIDEMKNT